MSDPSENARKKVDPGWNDPPMLKYNSSNPPPKSRITNKRIAFPINSSSTGNANVSKIETIDYSISAKQLQEFSIRNFDEVVKKSTNPEISTKLDIMKTMWKNNEFSLEVQKLIYDISQQLFEENVTLAKDCELKLMMNYANICSSWIIMVRLLINEIENKK